MNPAKNAELAFTFLSGLIVGGACSWTYVRFLRATIRFYEQYIQERIDRQFTQMVRSGALGRAPEAYEPPPRVGRNSPPDALRRPILSTVPPGESCDNVTR